MEKKIETTEELAKWYDAKYKEMGGCWVTPAEECERHLDALGVTAEEEWRWLLDVGCGGGHFLEQAEKRVNCAGFEISEVARLECEQRLHSSVYSSSIEKPIFVAGCFDYIVSLGSLEHIVDIGAALDNIHYLSKPDGKWYFYCPNELWQHFDQPNERTMTDPEWIALFAAHGLKTTKHVRWGTKQDNTAFLGCKV